MRLWYLLTQGIVLLLVGGTLYAFLRKYKTKLKDFYPLFVILGIFTIGFSLRLSDHKQFIDFGYFLTELSFLFTYTLFTATLILGQKKYWRLG